MNIVIYIYICTYAHEFALVKTKQYILTGKEAKVKR